MSQLGSEPIHASIIGGHDPHETLQALPTDLVREIFEMSARSCPYSIPAFMLVAWRVKAWVEPLLYRTIVWSRAVRPINALPIARGPAFFNATETKPGSFLSDNVRHLMLEGGGKGGIALLAACRGVEDLWLGSRHFPGALFPLIEDLPLTRLSCNLQSLFGPPWKIDFTHGLFAKITHLEFSDYQHPVDANAWGNLALVPHLTHLSFYEPIFINIFHHLLRTCHSLRVLVMLERDWAMGVLNKHPQRAAMVKDPRFVMMYCYHRTRDWQMGVLIGIDYWSRAEDLVAQRISGEVDALQCRIEEDESCNIE
ncbi:hypothetical protein B0H19DRAFT_1371449 [Mycena capillaripes]|nr:hypothetical protein B0H19DRAFT_1371449 [Mycena capillaripes]